MPKSLSDAAVRNAKPRTKPYKIADGEGLFLLVMPNGAKYWRLKYFFSGKEKTLALGVYPHVPLADARDRRAEAKRVLAAGIDPGEAKKQTKQLATFKAANTFEAIAREWYDQRKHEWSPKTAGMVLDRLERHILPRLSQRPIAEINAPEVLAVLRVVEGTGALEMTRRVMHICGQVFMYAIATGRAERNPVSDLRGALKSPVVKHRAYLKEKELPAYVLVVLPFLTISLSKRLRNRLSAGYSDFSDAFLPESILPNMVWKKEPRIVLALCCRWSRRMTSVSWPSRRLPILLRGRDQREPCQPAVSY